MATDPARNLTTRERILEVALELFATEGFSRTTITAVERRAGLAAGTGSFYRHFHSKEDLLRVVVEREVARCRTESTEARRSVPMPDDPHQRRVLGWEMALHDIQRFALLIRLMMAEGDRVPELREVIVNALEQPTEQLSGELRMKVVLGIAALGGYHLFSFMQGRPFQDMAPETFVEALATFTKPDEN